MSQEKTHGEIRNGRFRRELIEITEDMHAAMRNAAEADAGRFAVDLRTPTEEANNSFRAYDQEQRFFVDVSKDAFVEEDHPARIIDGVVERSNSSRLYRRYSDEGNPAYHPKVMLKVLFYAYYIGVMSSRTIRVA